MGSTTPHDWLTKMAGGLQVRRDSKDNSVFVINTEYDTEYDRVQIAERFEVPYIDMARASRMQRLKWLAMVEVVSKEVGRNAIWKYERLRHWKFCSERPVVLDQSEAQYDLEQFTSSTQKDFKAVEQGSNIDTIGKVAYVLKMWFIMPKQRVEVITPEPGDPDVVDGMVNPYNITPLTDLTKGFVNGIRKDIS